MSHSAPMSSSAATGGKGNWLSSLTKRGIGKASGKQPRVATNAERLSKPADSKKNRPRDPNDAKCPSPWFLSDPVPWQICVDLDEASSPRMAIIPYSAVECMYLVIKGTHATVKSRSLKGKTTMMWIPPTLQSLNFKSDSREVSMQFEDVELIKSFEKSIVFNTSQGSEPVSITFPNREGSLTWMQAFLALVPKSAKVRSRTLKCNDEKRLSYNLFEDFWGGKKLYERPVVLGYVLLGTIGKGGFSRVRLTLSLEDKCFYAVKIISKSVLRRHLAGSRSGEKGSTDVSSKEMNSDEFTIMTIVDHPNVVKYREIHCPKDSDSIYIFQEYIPCGSVMTSSCVEGVKTLTEERTRELTRMVLNGLHYLHAKKIAHLDIKPENLLTLADGSVKIADFGTAEMYKEGIENSSRDRTKIGTPAFAAPELCLSEHAPPGPPEAYPADVWSLGATLYYMVFGKVPFTASKVFDMYDRICCSELKFPSSPLTSKEFQVVVRGMMTKDPVKRWSLEDVENSAWFCEEDDQLARFLSQQTSLSSRSEGSSRFISRINFDR
uniref:Protein kinase domain-containing protein n=2 Tax=Rhodosorus marinus TaxID=101924 RepID=A0A7S2ZCH7_9RHOD|mmetsp:Transcript_14645/g.59609  ORF Transcript_14645/g.59609 Transcript_14645/m.59609 type:complete len:550 (+) Transcript_14645:120-1769(+)